MFVLFFVSCFVGFGFCNRFDLGFVLIFDNQTNGQPVFLTATPRGNYASGNGKHDIMLGHGSFDGMFFKGGPFLFRTTNQTRGQWSGQLDSSHDNQIMFCFLDGSNITSGVGTFFNITSLLNLTVRAENYGTQKKLEIIFGGDKNLTCGLWDKGWYSQSGPDHFLWMIDFCWTCFDLSGPRDQFCYSRNGRENKTSETFNVTCPSYNETSTTVAPSTTSICRMGADSNTVVVMSTAVVISALVSTVNGVLSSSSFVTTTSVLTTFLSIGTKATSLLLNGVGNMTNVSISCFRYCNGFCNNSDCDCLGNGLWTCCSYGNNNTRCKYYPGFGPDYWDFWFSFGFWFMFGLLVFILIFRILVYCFGFKRRNSETIITDGKNQVQVYGVCFKLVVYFCFSRGVESVFVGPNDFGRWFFDRGDFGFSVGGISKTTVGSYFGDRCCLWKPKTAGGITCCSGSPGDWDPCYASIGKWDCRAQQGGLGGWNDGCFCEDSNCVTWCCLCNCEKSWMDYRFDFSGKWPRGFLTVTNGTDREVLKFNNTGTVRGSFVNVTISGCGTPPTFEAGFNGKSWGDDRLCGINYGGSPPYGSVTCTGHSNWGNVDVLCWCPGAGEVKPVEQNVDLFSANGSMWGQASVGCDFNFDWQETSPHYINCSNWWCGDVFGKWCSIHIGDGPCYMGGRILQNGTIGLFCGNDGVYMGKKCNGTKYPDVTPGPYDPNHGDNVGPKSGFDKFVDKLKKWIFRWFDYVVAAFVFICVLILFECVLRRK